MRPRACAAVLRNDTILMVRHRHGGRDYWTLPGGGIEPGETPAQAAVRELFEETGLNGVAVRPLFEEPYLDDGSLCFCWLLTLVEEAQEAAAGYDPEEAHLEAGERTLQEVARLPLDSMAEDGQVAQVIRALTAG